MIKKPGSYELRLKKKKRIRRKISGTPEQPRLSIFKSINHIYAQIIDDVNGVTLAAASTLEQENRDLEQKNNTEAAKRVGASIGKKARDKGIEKVVFDRSGYKYHGKVAAFAEAARESGLKF